MLIALLIPSVSRADRVITASNATVTVDCGKEPIVQIVGNTNTVQTSGRCSDVIVDGNDNRVTVSGSAHVNLRGNYNTLDLAAVDALDVLGNQNSVQRTAKTRSRTWGPATRSSRRSDRNLEPRDSHDRATERRPGR